MQKTLNFISGIKKTFIIKWTDNKIKNVIFEQQILDDE